jgi:hypothetical protein
MVCQLPRFQNQEHEWMSPERYGKHFKVPSICMDSQGKPQEP